MSVKNLLKEEIEKEMKELGKSQLGSDQYKSTVYGVTQLADRLIEFEKMDNDVQDKAELRENEREAKLEELDIERKDRLVKNVLTGVSVGGGLILSGWGMYQTFKFEETGTITSFVGKNLLSRFIPKK